jgi:hypothetical protein
MPKIYFSMEQNFEAGSTSASYDRASFNREKQNFYSNVWEHAAKEESQVWPFRRKSVCWKGRGKA